MIKISTSFCDWCTENKPELLKEWDYEENNKLGITPQNITHGSGKKVWWICEKGHEWKAQIVSRTYTNSGCPYCSGRLPIVGINDLSTTHPELAKQWHPVKNGKLKPTDVFYWSNKKVWWMCEKGHEWKSLISKGNKCPYCANRKVFTGFNDLATKCPTIAKQWHPTKNGDLHPRKVLHNSSKKVWWICDKGHEWEAPISNRTGRLHSGCPYCTNKKVLTGYNDLATTHPELAKEWHPTKNGGLNPTDVTFGSNKKVWWMCKKGHEWKALVSSRAGGKGCAKCSSAGTSQIEKLFLFYLAKYGNTQIIHKYRELGFELDIYIPSLKVGIEYDGSRFHKNTKKDMAKNKKCIENDIKLFRIREAPLQPLNDTSIDICYNYFSNADLKKTLNYLLTSIFQKNIEVDIKENCTELNERINLFEKENSLIATHPEIAKQWHPTKNGKLKPENFTYGSPALVWWMCDKGHEWQATIHNRTTGRNCPYCAGKKAWIGYNDLATTHPELAKLWHPTKNGDLKPTNVTANSHKEVWWICEKGHEYKCRILDKKQKNGDMSLSCPYCINKRILIGYNDLATTHPEIAKQWHLTKNGDLKPTDVTAGSDKTIWWQCEKGHEWQAKVYQRSGENNCPYCSNQKVLVGYNDLATTHPELAKEWHPTKNGDLNPTDIVAGSNKKFGG